MASTAPTRSREKLHLQLAGLFRNRIATGVWPVGGSIPTLEELIVSHGASRTTVRMALGALIDEGLLLTRKRGGTQVMAKPFRPPSFLLPATWQELVAFGSRIQPETLERSISAPPQLPAGLRIAGELAPSYQKLLRVHSHAGERFCLSVLFLESRTYAAHEEQLATRTLAEALGNDPSTIATARQYLSVVPADDFVSNHLGVSIGTPLMQVWRWACNADGLIVYWAKVSFITEYVHLEMDLLK